MRFRSLDGLRGICSLTVAMLHFSAYARLNPGDFIEHSYVFVDFFFVLSGFVLAFAYLDGLESPQDGAAFMLRRFGRLYPLHFFVLMLWLAMETARWVASRHGSPLAEAPFTDSTSLESLFSNLLLIQALGLHGGITWNYPSWSISVEFYTNLLFAIAMLVAALFAPIAKVRLACALAAAGAVASYFLVQSGKVMTFDFGIVRCVYGFFCGVATQRLYAATCAKPSLSTASFAAASAVETSAILIIVLFVFCAPHAVLLLAGPLVFSAATFVFAHEAGLVTRLLHSKPFSRLGEWSYSIYMVHAFILINLMGRGAGLFAKQAHIVAATGADAGQILGAICRNDSLGAFAVIAIYTASLIGVSALTYRWIETPARRAFNAMAANFDPRVRRPTAGSPASNRLAAAQPND